MNTQLLFAIVLQPNLDGFIPFLPALAILLVIVGIAVTNPQLANIGVGTINSKVAAVTVAQLILLSGFAVKNEMVVRSGNEVTLAIHPYDPYDFFRGNYLRFRFDISNLETDKLRHANDKDFDSGSPVYVVLERSDSDQNWKATAIYDQYPKAEVGQVVLKGVVESAYGKSVNVHYGIEQYFYPDRKKIVINKTSIAKVKVDNNGDAVLTEVMP